MAYFTELPSVLYQFPDNIVRQYSNISFRPAVIERVIRDASNFIEYTIEDGDTPDSIAYDYYGDATLHWVLLLTNNITNYYTQWPKTRSAFELFLRGKYRQVLDSDGGLVNLTDAQVDEYVMFTGTSPDWSGTIEIRDSDGITTSLVRLRPHHFEDDAGQEYEYDLIVNNPDPRTAWGIAIENFPVNPAPINIFTVEDRINTSLRRLILLKQSVISEIRYELRALANGG